jgi:Fe-S cluster assembly ATP-binding protein
MEEKIKLLKMPEDLLTRSVNVGFSGGEKKRNDILQMAVLEPELCILDETDSGLDIDALKIVADGVNSLRDGRSLSSRTTSAFLTTSNRITSMCSGKGAL